MMSLEIPILKDHGYWNSFGVISVYNSKLRHCAPPCPPGHLHQLRLKRDVANDGSSRLVSRSGDPSRASSYCTVGILLHPGSPVGLDDDSIQ